MPSPFSVDGKRSLGKGRAALFTLDHIAVAGETLVAAVEHSEAALDVPLGPGGQHTHYATHNRLLGLADGLYFEAIAIDPSQPAPAYPRWFGLDEFQGRARLDKWILRCDDISAAMEAFPNLGAPVHLTRGDVSWTMIVPDTGLLPFDGLFPAIIQWHTPMPPGKSLPSTELRLISLVVTHPEGNTLADLLGPLFSDTRITIERGNSHALEAVFETPGGLRVLR